MPINAKIEGAEIREVPLKDGQHDLEGFLHAIDDDTSVVWLCSPNNPTGSLNSAWDLISFLKQVPENILVVLDEAYFEYITDPVISNTINLLEEFPNCNCATNVFKSIRTCRISSWLCNWSSRRYRSISIKFAVLLTLRQLGWRLLKKHLDDDEFIKQCRTLNREQMERFSSYADGKQTSSV